MKEFCLLINVDEDEGEVLPVRVREALTKALNFSDKHMDAIKCMGIDHQIVIGPGIILSRPA